MEHEERRAVAPKASSTREAMAVGVDEVLMAVNRMRMEMTHDDARRSVEKHQAGRQTTDISDLGLT
jgi:hypothetical protein